MEAANAVSLDRREAGLPPSSRGERSRVRTRARLTAAAREVIAAKGIDAATINEITEAADVGFGSFYNHFSSKEEILDAVIDEALELHGQVMDRLTADESDPAAVVATALHATLSLTGRDPVWGWLLVRVGIVHESLIQRLGTRLRRDLQSGIDAGRFSLQDPAVAEWAIGGAMMAVVKAKLDRELDDSANAALVQLMLRMLGLSQRDSARLAERCRPKLEPA
jgi:AcrR family transcriptional regulator